MSANTRVRERGAFLARLRAEPAFLMRHAPALSHAMYRKARNLVRLRFASVHQGRKLWPGWLTRDEQVLTPDVFVPSCLPEYPHAAGPLVEQPGVAPTPRGEAADQEDYLSAHRWGFLTQDLLEGRLDRQARLEECRRWIAEHTDRSAPHWEPYSTCERIANLLVFLAASGDRTMSPELRQFVQQSLAWIYRHLEYYGPAETNNHILNNARALVLAGVAIGNEAATRAGIRILRMCLPRLILEGGALRERSSHYQLIVLNWVLDAWRFLSARAGAPDDVAFLATYCGKMARVAAFLCDGSSRLSALIGDVSPDMPPLHSLARLRRLYPQWWPADTDAAEIVDGWFRMSTGEQEVLGNFPPDPYPPAFPTHGHCDLTSFVWRHRGAEVLADTGRYRYSADPVSLFQQSATGHNVPVVNGFAPVCETVIHNGSWCPLPYAGARLLLSRGAGSLKLEHDGFARSTPARRHVRELTFRPDALLVRDTFEGSGSAEVSFCWHFGLDFDAFDADGFTVRGRLGEVRLSFEGVSERPDYRPICGEPPGSWISQAYGRKAPTVGISLTWRLRLPVSVTTRFDIVA